MKIPTLMVLISLACTIVMAGFACASIDQTPAQAEVSGYHLEDNACTKSATSKADDDVCRTAVLKKYCAMWTAADAGIAACAFADAGSEGGK